MWRRPLGVLSLLIGVSWALLVVYQVITGTLPHERNAFTGQLMFSALFVWVGWRWVHGRVPERI
jgi:hypothetical protein